MPKWAMFLIKPVDGDMEVQTFHDLFSEYGLSDRDQRFDDGDQPKSLINDGRIEVGGYGLMFTFGCISGGSCGPHVPWSRISQRREEYIE
jgi:hypothetical protein